MNWHYLESIEELDEIIQASFVSPQLIFKHSTRCSISSMAKNRLEMNWTFIDGILKPYYLDLLKHRSVSNEIAEQLSVPHESPQILILKNGLCIYTASHSDININDIKTHLV